MDTSTLDGNRFTQTRRTDGGSVVHARNMVPVRNGPPLFQNTTGGLGQPELMRAPPSERLEQAHSVPIFRTVRHVDPVFGNNPFRNMDPHPLRQLPSPMFPQNNVAHPLGSVLGNIPFRNGNPGPIRHSLPTEVREDFLQSLKGFFQTLNRLHPNAESLDSLHPNAQSLESLHQRMEAARAAKVKAFRHFKELCSEWKQSRINTHSVFDPRTFDPVNVSFKDLLRAFESLDLDQHAPLIKNTILRYSLLIKGFDECDTRDLMLAVYFYFEKEFNIKAKFEVCIRVDTATSRNVVGVVFNSIKTKEEILTKAEPKKRSRIKVVPNLEIKWILDFFCEN